MNHITLHKHLLRLFALSLLWVVSVLPHLARATEVDVSGQVTVTKSGLVLNRATNTFDSVATLTNSLIPISAPVRLLVTGISPATVTLANAGGTTAAGKPYLNILSSGTLVPGASAKATLKFSNPQRVAFTFTTQVVADVQSSAGSNAVIEALGPEGGIIGLPGTVTLRIPRGSIESSAFEVAVIPLPELDALLLDEPNYTDPGLPRIKIKSSTLLTGSLDIRIPLPDNLREPALAAKLALFAVEPYADGDGEGPATTLAAIDRRLCDAGTAICATLEPGHFMPVPEDPDDPLIQLVVLSKLAGDTTTPLKLVHPIVGSESPKNGDKPIDISSPITFKVGFEIRKEFANLTYPLSKQVLINSAFKEFRKDSGRPHTGLDLLAPADTNVLASYAGPIYYGGTIKGGGNCVSTIGPIQAIQLEHDMQGTSFFTRYLHLKPDSFDNTGSKAVGDKIALSGTSGACDKATGKLPRYHLHFDVMPKNKKFIDPRPLLPAINDLSLYLLPHDCGTNTYYDRTKCTANSDNGLSPEPYLRLRLKYKSTNDNQMGNALWGDSQFMAYGVLNRQYISEFASAYIDYSDVSGGPEGQTGLIRSKDALVGTVLETPVDANGSRYARINYVSPPIDLASSLDAETHALGKLGEQTTVADLLTKSKVVAEICTFRLGKECIEIASWDLKPNTPPVAVNDSASTKAGTAITIDVKANDFDPDGTPNDELKINSATVDGGAAKGTVEIQQDGKLLFTPATGVTGTVTVQYTLTDPFGAVSNVASVAIKIAGVSTSHWSGSYFISTCTPVPTNGVQWYWQNPCNAYLPAPAYSGAFYFDDESSDVILQSNHFGFSLRDVAQLNWKSTDNSFAHSIDTEYGLKTLLAPFYTPRTITETGKLLYTFRVERRSPTEIGGTFTVTMKSGYFQDANTYLEWFSLPTQGSGSWSANFVNTPKPLTQMNGYDFCSNVCYGGSNCAIAQCETGSNPVIKPSWCGSFIPNTCRYQ